MGSHRISKVQDALEEAGREVDHILIHMAQGKTVPDVANVVWKAQSRVEYAIALLKLHLKVENPGLLLKKENIPVNLELKETIVEASDHLTSALKKVKEGDYIRGLDEARKARDSLRRLLAHFRKIEPLL